MVEENELEELEEGLEVEELTEEEAEETTGGAGGYGNVVFVCRCGRDFLTEDSWLFHLVDYQCKYGYVYKQNNKRKNKRGEIIGKTTVKRTKTRIQLVYPSGWKRTVKQSNYEPIDLTDDDEPIDLT